MYEDVYFDYVDELNIIHCYIQCENYKTSITFNQHGTPNSTTKSKCVIFPKGKTTWEGFVHPCKFKDGDVAISDSGDIHLLRTANSSYCAYRQNSPTKLDKTITIAVNVVRFATEEEKAKLFQAIKDNGYKWNSDTKTLEKLLKFNDGDIIADEHGNIAIYKGTMWYNKKLAGYYCGYRKFDNCFIPEPKKDGHFGSIEELRFATEEEKQKLFAIIKANDYHWNPETKTLEKLVEPRFKVGDRIKSIISSSYYTVVDIKNDQYFIKSDTEKYPYQVPFSNEINYKLVLNKFDINTLIPFESRVLVRDNNLQKWSPAMWGYYDFDSQDYPYKLIGGAARYCIPYEKNEYLLGTTNDCDNFFKTW
jgi:hypothetical protein